MLKFIFLSTAFFISGGEKSKQIWFCMRLENQELVYTDVRPLEKDLLVNKLNKVFR